MRYRCQRGTVCVHDLNIYLCLNFIYIYWVGRWVWVGVNYCLFCWKHDVWETRKSCSEYCHFLSGSRVSSVMSWTWPTCVAEVAHVWQKSILRHERSSSCSESLLYRANRDNCTKGSSNWSTTHYCRVSNDRTTIRRLHTGLFENASYPYSPLCF